MTLSTTEPNNNIGLLKIRQADDETQVFDVTITENGVIKPFTGFTPFFCLMAREVTGQGVSEEPVAIFDAANGTLKYTVSANAMQMVGRNEAYFSFRRQTLGGRWIEQFSTKFFNYTVEKSIYTQPFKDSNYWFTFKELYQKFLEYQDDGKVSWEDFVNQNREIIESIDPGGVVLSEIIDSREDFSGTTYQSLKDRLNVGFAEKVNVVNSVSRTTESREISFGTNVLSEVGWSTTGWSGSFSEGFTHISGNTTPLIVTLPNLLSGKYQIDFDATDVGTETGGTSDFYITLNDSYQFETYKGTFATTKYELGLVHVSGDGVLKIIPRDGWTGKISNLRLRLITNTNFPHYLLQDSANSTISEIRSSKNDNLFLGKNSGRFITSGTGNYTLGDGAMEEATTAFWNVAIGTLSQQKAISSSRNVSAGYQSLRDIETGHRNVALGSFAGLRMKNGYHNILLGADSGWFLEDAHDNVVLGTVGLGNNKTANNVIALGERVMSNSQDGNHVFAAGRLAGNYNQADNNVFIGNMAGYQNKTGSGNFVAGSQASQANQSGSYNTAIGRLALNKSTSSSNNVAVGYMSQFENLTGQHNISVGNSALENNKDSHFNIALGASALTAFDGGDGTGENIAIGRNAAFSGVSIKRSVALGANALQKSNGERDVAIGTSAGLLHVNGLGNIFLGASAGSNHVSGDRNIIIGFDAKTASTTSSDYLSIGGVIKSDMTTKVIEMAKLLLSDLPTKKPTTTGEVWNDGGTLKIA